MKQYPSSKTFSPSENRSGAVSELYDLAHPQAVLQCAVLGSFFGEGAEKGLKASEIQMEQTILWSLDADFCS